MCDIKLDSLVEACDDELATRPYLAAFDEDTASMRRSDLEVLLEQGRPTPPDLRGASANTTPLPTSSAVPLSVAPVTMAPSATTLPPPAATGSRGWVRTFAYGALGCVLGGALAVAVVAKVERAPAAPVEAAAPIAAATIAPVTVTPEVESVPADAEREAKDAVTRLAEGLAACARATGALPGSSPAVPESADQLAGAGYAPKGAEWSTPVWRCARFQGPETMRFQIQWQLVRPGTEGRAVAWIDADGDGKAERAVAVRVLRADRDPVTIGAAQVIDPMPAVLTR
jgi:hypothetical protein